ncbi:uncharacterized protein LOC100200648 [Hydra vulgaris]|uniref:uncharacterized protein LOC100200648 n=1 Tax=Hydra vulgaris TaxID=6087 RepID=UPI0032EA11AF
MSGVYKGVQAIILQRNPQAFYMPCSTHNLNLAGVHSLESSVEMKNYFGRIQLLYNLFSGSPIRWKILTETTGLSLHQTSQTRWSARIEAVKPLVKRPREILLSLQKLRDLDLTADLLIDVKSLEKWIQSFEFIIMTTFWFKALQAINYVSVSFQSENITLDDEMKLMKILIEDLTRLRSSWPELINETHLVASGLASYGFQSKLVQKRTRKRKTFYEETRNEVHFLENDEKQFKVNVFNTALDTLIQQIKDKFQAAEKTTNSFSFLWLSESNSRSSEEKEIEQPSLEEKCKTLAQMYVNDVDEDKLILEVRHLDTLKRANLFGPKEYLTSMKLLNGIYQKECNSATYSNRFHIREKSPDITVEKVAESSLFSSRLFIKSPSKHPKIVSTQKYQEENVLNLEEDIDFSNFYQSNTVQSSLSSVCQHDSFLEPVQKTIPRGIGGTFFYDEPPASFKPIDERRMLIIINLLFFESCHSIHNF